MSLPTGQPISTLFYFGGKTVNDIKINLLKYKWFFFLLQMVLNTLTVSSLIQKIKFKINQIPVGLNFTYRMVP